MKNELSEFAESLAEADDEPFKTSLLRMLSDAEHNAQEPGKSLDEVAYYQGKKDALRMVLSEYLNMPSIGKRAPFSAYDVAKIRNITTAASRPALEE